MANQYQLFSQYRNKLCADLTQDFNLKNLYICIDYKNVTIPYINIDTSDYYTFYNSALGFVPSIYVPFLYKKLPVILNY